MYVVLQRVGVEIVMAGEVRVTVWSTVLTLQRGGHGDTDSGGVRGVLHGCMWSYSVVVWRRVTVEE